MRGLRTAAAVGVVLAMVAGCRSSESPTTSLEKIPEASGPGASSWGSATSLESLPEGSRKPFGPAPPESLFGEPEELPLPSRHMVPARGVQKTIDRVVGRVNADIITLSEVQELAHPILGRLRDDLPAERREREVRKVLNQVLDRIIDFRLQAQHARRLGVTASPRELDEAVADVMQKNNLTPEKFDVLLAQEGLTMQQYREKIEEQIIRRRVYDFEVATRVRVTDADVQDFYLENLKEFVPDPEVVLSQIFIALPTNGDELARLAARKKAEVVLAALKQGEPFAQVARTHSEDPTRARGGLLGRFAPGEMIPALEKVAFEMSEGEIRGPVTTDRGLHFLKVDQKRGDRPLALDQVKDQVRNLLSAKKRNERYTEWMEVLRGDAFIERVDLLKAPGGRE